MFQILLMIIGAGNIRSDLFACRGHDRFLCLWDMQNLDGTFEMVH